MEETTLPLPPYPTYMHDRHKYIQEKEEKKVVTCERTCLSGLCEFYDTILSSPLSVGLSIT